MPTPPAFRAIYLYVPVQRPPRATSVGIYRLWRDSGYAVGAIVTGVIADAAGFAAAIVTIAALTGVSGVIVAVRMRESGPSLVHSSTSS